jgi:hypothetical protein
VPSIQLLYIVFSIIDFSVILNCLRIRLLPHKRWNMFCKDQKIKVSSQIAVSA